MYFVCIYGLQIHRQIQNIIGYGYNTYPKNATAITASFSDFQFTLHMTSQTGSRQGAAVRLSVLDHSAAFHDVQPMPLLAPRYAPELAHQVKEYDETFRA
jgi:hypothetical protein